MNSKDLLKLLIRNDCLRFGNFTTKSGRVSPYFLNIGAISKGADFLSWIDSYCHIIQESFAGESLQFYGPAYKGIPIVAGVSAVLAGAGVESTFTFNRKEEKAHGEKGKLIGHPLKRGDQVIILEDVLTGGTSIRESVDTLKDLGIGVAGAVVGIDRMEKGRSGISSKQEVAELIGGPVYSIANIVELNKELKKPEWIASYASLGITDAIWQQISDYQDNFLVVN